MKKHSFLLTVLAVFSLIFAILISCEIGLGGAVDTEPPTVEITYPQKNVIIKDSFLMSGTCDDETGVASVTLVFENNNTKQQYTYQAKIGEDKKTWSCEINKFDDTTKNYPLPDGKYNVTATAQDTAERTSQASVTYTIDNTAPLLVLENPSTVLNEAGTNLSDAGAFGATIKIKGKVVDAGTDDENNFANGSRLVFTVFDENNNFLAARTLDYVPDSLGVTVAEYAGENSSSDLTEAQKFYSDIYGEKTEGDETKYRKFKISVSDAARTYKGDGTVGSERGNTSDCYYLQDEIYADVNYKYTKTLVDVFTILKKENANYESLTSQENEILTALEKYKHLTDDFKTESEVTEGATWNAPVGTFSVNPSDSPSYEVTSLEPFDSSAESLWTGRKVSSSGSITLLAKCGPNDVPLKSTSFELAVYELDEKGNKISEESKTILPCEWTKNGSSYSGKTTLSSSLVGVTKHYEIVLSGSDEAENAFYNGSTRYCFEVQAGVTPPTFEVSDFLVLKNEALSSEGTVAAPKSGSSIFLKKSTKDASKGIDLIVKGSAKNNSGAAGAGVRVFAQINGEIVDEKTIGGSSSSSDSDDGDSWTLTISGEKLKVGNNNVTFVAEDDVLNQTTKEYTIVLDTEDPVILISNVNNVVTFDKDAKLTVGSETFDVKAGRGYVNDIVTFKGSISDNDAFSDGSWKATYINASGETKELASGEFTSTTLNISVNTAKDDYAADGRELKLEITANDRAGNATTYSYSYDDGNQLIISKLTDYPRITLSNADNSITEKTGVKVGQNLFDQTGNNKISGSVIDDDGLDTIVMQYQDSSENWQDVATLSAGEKSSYSFSQALVDNTSKAKLAEGFYKIRFVATDTAGNTLTTEAFEICISNSAPSITFTNPVKNTEDYKGDSFNATGSLTGMFDTTNSSATILKRGNKVITVGENLTWTDKITYKDDLSDNGTPAEGSGITKAEGSSVYTVEYTVTDIFGRETTDSVKFKVDKTAPVVEVTDAADMAYLGKTKSSIYSFTGTVTEEDVLKTLEYSTDGKEWSASDKVWTSITAQKSWSANIDFSSFGDGDVTVCFRAKDEAGNTSAESDSAKRTIKVISVAPVVTITGVEANGSAITKNADDGVYYVNKTYSISGNVASSAFDSLKYGSNSVNIDDSGNFKVENLAASGSYSFVVTDKAGQTATTSISVVYDSENPKPEVSQVSPLVTSSTIADAVEALKTYKNGAVNGTITLQGTASDNDKVTSTDLKVFKADGSEVTTDGLITKDSGNTATNFKFTVDTTKLEDDKGITLQLISTDRTGNVATADYPVFVCQETDIPVMTSSNSDLALTDANGIKVGENLFGMGSNTFYLNVSDDDGVKNVTYIVDGNADKSVSLLKDGTSTSFDSSINISNLGDGLHTLKFTVEDVNGKSQSFPAGDAAIQVAFDDDVPDFSVTNLGSVTYSQNVIAPANFTLTGSIKDSSGQVTIYRESVDDSNKVSTVDCVKEVTWTDEVTNEEGDCTKKYIALDKFGRKREISIKYSVDVTKPVVKVTDYNSTSYVGSSGVGTFTVAIDEINNLSKVEYSTDGLDWTDSGKKWTSIQAQKSFTTNITLPSTCTKIEFRATDEAGNVSECTSECARSLMVLASPTFGSFTVKADENKITAENETFYLNKAFTISGSYTSKALEALTYNLNGISTKVTSDTADANGSANFSVTGLEAGGNYEFTVTDKAGQTKTARVQVVYDTSEPSVEITSVNDVVRFDQDTTLTVGSETFDVKAGTGYVNGSVTFKGSISDNDAFKSGTWRAYYKDGTTENKLATGTLSSTAINITVDTSANSYAGDGKELYLEIKATDRAGNTTTYSYSYDDGNQLVISKLTDYPRVSLSNADLSVISTENVKSGTNLFNQTDNNKLGIAVTDDDGINKVTVLYKKLADTNDYATLSEFTVGGKTSDSRQIPLVANSAKLDEGFYNIKIEASDSGSEAKTYTTAPFVICISNSAPSFNFTNPTKNSESFQQYEFTAKGTVTGMLASGTKIYRGKTEINVGNDGSWKDDITCAKLDGNGNVDSYVDLPEWTEDSGTVENNGISTSDGVLYTITYSVEDQFGRKTTDTVSFKSDFVKPVVTINDAATPAYVGTKLTTLYSFTGKVVEANSLKSVEYSFDGENWVNVGNQKEFNANVDFKAVKDTATDGKITVYFRATDGADLFSNETNDSKRGVIFLADGPVFSDMAVKVGDKELSENEGIYYANNSYTISGKVTSAALDSLKLGSDVLLDENATDGTFSTTISNPTAGTNTYTLVATDKAKQTSSQTIQVVYDVTKPSPQISQVSPLVTNTTVAAAETPLKTYKNGAVNGTITLQGTASDNDKVTSTILKVYKAKIDSGSIVVDGDALDINGLITSDASNTANNFKFTVDTTKVTDNAGIILRVESTDRTGNGATTDYPVFVCQETDKPVMTSSNSDVTLTDASGIKVGKNLFGMGSNTLYLNVSDDDGVASVTYTVDDKTPATELLKDGKSTTFDGTIDVSTLGSGEHKLKFTVTDVNGKTQTFPSDTSASICVAYDDDVPELSVTSLGNITYSQGVYAPASFTLKGSIKDSSGSVKIYENNTSGSPIATSEKCANGVEWIQKIEAENDGKITKTYVAVDKFGRTSTINISYTVDKTAPVVTVTGYNSAVPLYVGTSGIGTFTGNITEAGNLASVEYSTDGLGWDNENKKWTSIQAGGNSFTANITLPEDCTKVEFRATDAAGNVSANDKTCVRKVTILENPKFGSFTVKADAEDNNRTAEKEIFYLNKAFTISGSYTSEAVKGVTCKLNGTEKTVTSDENAKTFTVSGLTDGGNYEFTVTDEVDQIATARIQVVYDATAPIVDFSNVTGIVTVDEKTTFTDGKDSFETQPSVGYVNGTIKVSGNITDDYFQSGTYKVTSGKNNKEITSGNITTSKFSFDIDTTQGSNGDELTITITAKDKSGNTVTKDYEYGSGSASGDDSKLVIHQLTDYPRVSLSNADANITTLAKITKTENLFAQTGNNKITGSIVDDDGISSVEIQYKSITVDSSYVDTTAVDSTGEWSTLSTNASVGGKTSYSFSQELKTSTGNLAEGMYAIRLVVKDSQASAKELTTTPFAIYISNNAPVISFTSPTASAFASGSLKVEGKVTGVYVSGSKISRGSDTSKQELDVNSGSFSETITLSDILDTDGSVKNIASGISRLTSDGEEYSITYSFTDRFGRTSTQTASFSYDCEKPTVELTALTGNETEAYISDGSSSYLISGTASDKHLKSVEYVLKGENESASDNDVWTTFSNQTNWSTSISLTDTQKKAGKFKIYIRAKDEANNISEYTDVYRTVNMIAAPAITIEDSGITVVDGSSEAKKVSNVYYANGKYKISGKVTTTALSSLTVDGAEISNKSETTGGYTFTTGEYSESKDLVIKITDKAGQPASKTISVVYDTVVPTPEISQVSPLVTSSTISDAAEALQTYKNGAVNGTITLQGTASDNDKVTSTVLMIYQAKKNVDGETTTIVIDESATGTTKGLICALPASGTDTTYTGKITKDGESVAVITVPTGTTNTANNFRFNVDTSQLTDDSGIILRILTTDRAGNESKTDYPVFICQDTDLPVLTSSNSDVTLTDASGIKVGKNLFGMGSNTFYLNVSDDDGVASVYYTVDGGSTNELLKDGKSTTFDGTIDISKLGSGEHALRFTVVDKNGKKVFFPTGATAADDKTADQVDADTVATAGSAIQVAYDNDVPVISVTALGDKDYVSGAWAKNAFELKGTVSDSSGEVTIYSVSDNGAKTPITSTKDQTDGSSVDVSKIENCSSSHDWNTSVSGLLDTSDGKYASMTYLASDKYGREASTTINFQVDSQKPVFNSSNISITGSVPENGTPQSKTYYLGKNGSNDVYPSVDSDSKVWFSSSAFTIKGGNGSAAGVTETNGFRIYVYRYLLSSENTKDLISTIDPNGKNFSTTVNAEKDYSTTDGFTTFYLLAEDDAGNTSDPLLISVYVDQTGPSFGENGFELRTEETKGKIEANAYINVSQIYYNYSITEEGSGLKTVTVYEDNTKQNTLYETGSTKSIDTSYTKYLDKLLSQGKHTFYVEAIDNAGNVTSATPSTFIYDTVAPTVAFNSHEADDSINETITIEGSITEATSTVSDFTKWGLDSAVYVGHAADASTSNSSVTYKKIVSKATGDTEIVMPDFNVKKGNSITDFKITGFDTTKLEEGYNFIVVLPTDLAGNTQGIKSSSTNRIRLIVDQDTDRPVITLNNVNVDGTSTISSGTISGTISDDDSHNSAIVSSLEIQVVDDGKTPADDGWESLISGNTDKWSYTLKKTDENGKTLALDGKYQIYFRVKDYVDSSLYSTDTSANNVGNTFTSVTTTPTTDDERWKCPIIKYTGSDDEVATAVTFSIDQNPPKIDDVEYATSSSEDSDFSGWEDVSGRITLGGKTDKRYVKFRIPAYDVVSPQSDLTVTLTNTDLGFSYSTKSTDDTKKITLNTSGDTFTESGEAYYYFETPVIDFGGITPTGNFNLSIEAADAADKPALYPVIITVDNTAPDTLNMTKPQTNIQQTGNVVFSGSVDDDKNGSSGVVEMYYVIPQFDIKAATSIKDSDTTEGFGKKWIQIPTPDTGKFVTWEFTLTGVNNLYTQNGTVYNMNTCYASYETVSTGVYELPIWFKLVDATGNTAYMTDYKILYNPDADKPIVSITYPEHNNTTSKGLSYVTMGGTIRFTGTATDDAEGIDSVYLQFDMDGDGVYENGKNVDGCPSTVTVVDIPNSGDTLQQGVKVNGTQSWNYSLNVSKLSGLAITDDNTKTLNVRAVAVDKGDGTTDSTKLMGAWSQVLHISVSNDVPAFETVDLKQFSSDTDATNTTGTPVKTLSYQADEYLSGNYWYLEETISSTAGIGSVVVQRDGDDLGTIKVTNGSSSDSENTSYSEADYAVTMEDSTATAKITVVKAVTSTVGTITSMTYRIPLDCSGTSCNLNVTVTDTSDNNKSSTANYSLNIDNVAPSFVDKYAESEQAANGTVKIYKNTYGSTLLNSSSPIQNSNGTFTLVGRVSEAGSGYENVIFYFKRSTKDGTNVRVYNPMENHTTSGGSNPGKENRTDITVTTTLEEVTSPTSGQVYFNTDGLPVLYVTDATVDSVGFSVTADAVKDNANIRVGGLVKIGGVYRKITEVDSETGKVGFDIEYRTSSDSESETSVTVTAEFVYGMVIDNSGESSSGSGASATIKNDDGDGMVESYQKSGTNYTWDASINSKNIPDGPIELHVVAFDKAGNASHGYTITSISNNAPRLARVRLTTDLNGNGTYDESEGQIFANSSNDKTKTWTDALDTNTEGVQIWNLTSDSAGTNGWTIKNGLQLEPEFVGGTAPFYYVFSKSAGTGTAMNLTTPKSNTSLAKIAQTTAASDTTDTSLVIGKLVANKDAIQLGNALIDSTAEGGNSDFEGDSSNPKTNTYSFSFWDSTEETTPGSDSQWAVLNLQLNQDIADTVAPTVTVKPFYWKKSSDNSLYADNTEKDNGPDNGHIELEADLPDTFTDAGSGVDDRDPKVSGKIVLRGTAYDDIRLSSIWVKMTDGDTTPVSFNFASSLSTTTYSTGLTTTSDKYDGYALVAFYDSANSDWVIPSATMATNGWEFAIDTSESSGSYFNQTGHKVNWTLSLDTSKIGTSESNIVAAAADMTFSVMAVDHVQTTGHISSSTEATSDESDAKYNKPSYRMDVVPYITELTTKLSSIEKKKHSVYGRTALGKYPVYYYTNNNSSTTEGEPITVEGFNLTNGDVYLGTTKVATLSVNSFTIGSTMSSAMLSVKVNGIESLNNKNSNDAKGDYDGVNTNPTGDYDVYSNYYNRQPNNQNNNLLTDDVEIAVWQLNARAAKPSSGRIDAPIMHINPKNGLIGFAFTHGSDLVSYPNGTANSYLNYAKDWTSISQNSLDFVYDANGNMFGVHHGTDTASNNYKASRYKLCTSLWGVTSNWETTADYNTAYGDYNSLRLEYMGYSPDGTSVSNVLSPERITGSKLATSTTSAGTNLYLMYYDSAKDELKFKAGQNVPTSYRHKNSEKNPRSNCYEQSYTYFGDFYDDARLNVGAYNSEYQHITVVSNSSYTAARPSRYFAISVVPASITKTTDVVVAVWYDPKKRNLNYSYFEDPLTGAGSRTTESSTTGTCKTGTSGYWSTPVQILTLDAIGDCAIEVDADGHIHIAAYTRDSGNSVSYTYLDKYNSSYDEDKNTVLVDAYDSNGQYLTMDFAKNSAGKTIPYIGYMTSRGYPKYAYLVDTASSSDGSGVMGDETYYPKAGADENNMTTGAWEFIMVPTTTEINVNVNSKINIGVYRDSDGKLANIPSSISSLSVSAGTSSGVALGNGTSNPVLAYGTNDDGSGFIETAQLK